MAAYAGYCPPVLWTVCRVLPAWRHMPGIALQYCGQYAGYCRHGGICRVLPSSIVDSMPGIAGMAAYAGYCPPVLWTVCQVLPAWRHMPGIALQYCGQYARYCRHGGICRVLPSNIGHYVPGI